MKLSTADKAFLAKHARKYQFEERRVYERLLDTTFRRRVIRQGKTPDVSNTCESKIEVV